jgi:hypothetical protein
MNDAIRQRGQLRTPAEVLKQAEEEQLHREETMAWCRKLDAAAALPGLAGELRRAFRAAKLWPEEIERDCGIDSERLEASLANESALSSDEFERFAARLGLHLAPVEAGA